MVIVLKKVDVTSAQRDLAEEVVRSRTPASSIPYFVCGWEALGRAAEACDMLYLWQRLRERLKTNERSECWLFSCAGGTSECGGVGGLAKDLLSSSSELHANVGGSAVQQGGRAQS